MCHFTIGGSHQLISSDVIDLMGQLFDLITNANSANSAGTSDQPRLQTVSPPGGLVQLRRLKSATASNGLGGRKV